MFAFYERWIESWENQLANRDKNRICRPFEWGGEWLHLENKNEDIRNLIHDYVARAEADSGQFFSYQKPEDFSLEDGRLRFISPVATPHPENNVVHASYFPAASHKGRAVVVLPQWNADIHGHAGLCKLLNKFGLSALRMSMAYHDLRMPQGLERADYHVSSNIGRTIHACRQSVIDARACLDWLEGQGYTRLSILGTSLGSCIAFITAAHDARIRVGVYNHVSTSFGDVVWTGLTTQHVRSTLETEITQDELRKYWSVISPATFVDRYSARDVRTLLIWAKYDTSFLPSYSQDFLSMFRSRGMPHKSLCLPCAHYTVGKFPFNIVDGLAMALFLHRNL